MTRRGGFLAGTARRRFGNNTLEISPAGENGLQFVFTEKTRSGAEAAVTVTLSNTPRISPKLFDFLINYLYSVAHRRIGADVQTVFEIPTSAFTERGLYSHTKDAIQPFCDFLDALKSITIQGSIIRDGAAVSITRDGSAAPLVTHYGFSFDGGNICGAFNVALNDNIVWRLFVDEYTRAPIEYIFSAPAVVADLAAFTAFQTRIKRNRDGIVFTAAALFDNVIGGIDAPADGKEKARYKRLLEKTAAAWQAVDGGISVEIIPADSKKLAAWLRNTRIVIRFTSDAWRAANSGIQKRRCGRGRSED